MKVDVSGTRDGVDWPARGEIADLPAHEAADLIRAGLAEPASGAAPKATRNDVETATAPAGEQTRKPRRRAPIKTTATVGKPGK